MNPREFETAIAELFRKLGYKVTQTPFSNDGGKDAIVAKDGKKYLVECKRYSADAYIGRRDLQILVAAMQDEEADGGFYINTGEFTRPAREYAARNRIDLYDRRRLATLVNEAYPVQADISVANVMCLDCGSITSIPIGLQPTTGKCLNDHPIISNIVKGDFDIFSAIGVSFCPRCGSPMRIVNSYRGQFWGCTRYPQCKATRAISPPLRPLPLFSRRA